MSLFIYLFSLKGNQLSFWASFNKIYKFTKLSEDVIHLNYATGIPQLACLSGSVLNEQCQKTSPTIMPSFLTRGKSPKLRLNFGGSLATASECQRGWQHWGRGAHAAPATSPPRDEDPYDQYHQLPMITICLYEQDGQISHRSYSNAIIATKFNPQRLLN